MTYNSLPHFLFTCPSCKAWIIMIWWHYDCSIIAIVFCLKENRLNHQMWKLWRKKWPKMGLKKDNFHWMVDKKVLIEYCSAPTSSVTVCDWNQTSEFLGLRINAGHCKHTPTLLNGLENIWGTLLKVRVTNSKRLTKDNKYNTGISLEVDF